MKIKIAIFICFTSLKGFPQTEKTVEILKIKYQNCLNKGEFILGCSQTFYQEMDSLLNVFYNRIRITCDTFQKENFKDEQLIWLEKRDKNFNRNEKSEKRKAKKLGYEGGQIERMVIIDKNAEFVMNRVVKLRNLQAKNYSPQHYKVSSIGFYSFDSKKKK
jgi:uncharacterized protein YecT (DUF1311 family)